MRSRISKSDVGKSRGAACDVVNVAAAASAFCAPPAAAPPPPPAPGPSGLLGGMYVAGTAASMRGWRSAVRRPSVPMLARTAMVRPCSSTGTQL